MRHGFLVACVVAALVASGTMLYLGDTRGSVAAIIVAASALIFLRARGGDPRFRQRYWVGIGLLGGGLAILGFPIGVIAGSLAGLFVLQLLMNAFVARKIGQITLEALDHPEVMPAAEDFVQQFSAEGFRGCGSYRFRLGSRPVILTVMAGPEDDRLAVVTDKVLQISSRFGRRSVITMNSAVSPLPADVLRQQVAGSPAELVRAHEAALTLLNRHSIRPDVFFERYRGASGGAGDGGACARVLRKRVAAQRVAHGSTRRVASTAACRRRPQSESNQLVDGDPMLTGSFCDEPNALLSFAGTSEQRVPR